MTGQNLTSILGPSNKQLNATVGAGTSNPTPSTLVARDSNGSAEFTSPSNAAQVAIKGYVDSFEAYLTQDGILSGFVMPVPGSSSLTSTFTTGAASTAEAMVLGVRIVITSGDSRLAQTFAASKDSYVDLSNTGSINIQAVTNGASAPSVTANSIRLCKVVTSSSTITSVQTSATLTTSGGTTASAANGFASTLLTASPKQINQLGANYGGAAQNQGQIAAPGDFLGDYLVQGFVPPSLPILIANPVTFTGNSQGVSVLISQGNRIAYLNGDSRLSNVYTASKDTYVDVSGTGTFTYTAVTNGASAPSVTSGSMRLAKVVSSGTQVTGITMLAQTYAPIAGGPFMNQCRLYGTSGSPYADGGTGITNLCYGPCPDLGDSLSTYSALLNKWVTRSLSEITIPLTGLTSGDLYSIYVYFDEPSQTHKGEISVAWSGNTPPTMQTQDGKLVKGGDPTRLFVGIFKATSATTTNQSTSSRLVCNIYNKVTQKLFAASGSLGPAPIGIWSPLNTTDGEGRFSFVQGLCGTFSVHFNTFLQNDVMGHSTLAGVALDSTSAADSYVSFEVYAADASSQQGTGIVYSPSIGSHYVQQLTGTDGGDGSWNFLVWGEGSF